MDIQPLIDFLDESTEVIISNSGDCVLAASRAEIEIILRHNRAIIGYPSKIGFAYWRIDSFEFAESHLKLKLSNSQNGINEHISIIPRTKYVELVTVLNSASISVAKRIAAEIVEVDPTLVFKEIAIREERSRIAIITFQNQHKQRVICLIDLIGKLSPEILLSTSIEYFKYYSLRKNKSNSLFRIYCKRPSRLQKLLACMNFTWLNIFDLEKISAKPLKRLSITDIWRGKATKLNFDPRYKRSKLGREIGEMFGADYAFSKGGETLTYKGLPFFRVRRVAGREDGWFGTGRTKTPWEEGKFSEVSQLVSEIAKYRRFHTSNSNHFYFQEASEAWLEASIKHEIHRLDSNLILSPIYNQFSTSRDKIDLLALRKDGRLIIIEIKVSKDREMLFQAVDYWRKIEKQRRDGILREADLFAGREIANRPAIIYLIAPALQFHHQTDYYARLLDSQIEVYKFELKMNWREQIEVIERKRLGNRVGDFK